MTMEVADTVLLLPIGNMIGNVVAFKSMEIVVGNKVVLFPCEITEGFEYIVLCKPFSTDMSCGFEINLNVVATPIGGNKDYVVALTTGEPIELELQFTEPWEGLCAELSLQFTERFNEGCPVGTLEHEEEWET